MKKQYVYLEKERLELMTNLVLIDKDNYPKIYDESIDKYLLIDEQKNIIGISTINDSLNFNKIRINILDDYRGNGYGKLLFQKTLDEYKSKYNDKELFFKVQNKNLFNIILNKQGAVNIDNDDGILEYILPL